MGTKHKKWADKRRKYSWTKRMKQVRQGKGGQGDVNNNNRDENIYYNSNVSDDDKIQIVRLMMIEENNTHESLSQREDA